MHSPRLVSCVALVALASVLSGCNKQANEPVHMQMSSVTMTSTTTTTVRATTTTVAHKTAGTVRTASRPASEPRITSRSTAARHSAVPADYHAFADWPLWHCIGLHEQRGTGQYDTNGDGIAWHGSPAGGFPSSGYPGGLGVSREAWDDARGAAGVSETNGAYATPAEQIEVARVILRRHGLNAWATAPLCRSYL